MKKRLIAGASSLILALPVLGAPPRLPDIQPRKPLGAPLQITSPVGGENWYHGSYHRITWKAAPNITGTVELVLLRKGATLGVIAHDVPVTKGTYGWFVSNYTGGVAPTGGGYRVMVRSERSGVVTPLERAQVSSTSPGTFDLYLLVVTAPNGNETWPLGTVRAVTWNQRNMSGTVDVTLWRDTAYVAHMARSVPAAAGSFSWTVGTVLPGPPPPGTVVAGPGYRVCVKSTDAAYQGFDCSDVPFGVQ